VTTDTPRSEALATAVSEILYAIAGWLSIGLGLTAAASVPLHAVSRGADALPLVVLSVFAVCCLVFGAMVHPGIRARLARRRGLTRFGRATTVDQRVVRPAEECRDECVRCDRPVERGVVRRYREEYLAAGVPVGISSMGRNAYCADCAMEELNTPEETTTAGGTTRPDEETTSESTPSDETNRADSSSATGESAAEERRESNRGRERDRTR
jgi:hypothetical protein